VKNKKDAMFYQHSVLDFSGWQPRNFLLIHSPIDGGVKKHPSGTSQIISTVIF
jgi:hypothetical protein